MAKTDFKTIDDYIATFDGDDAAGLQAIRKAILSAVPDAEERISYQIPAFHRDGWIFYMSAHAHHFNLACPPPSAAFEAFEDALARPHRPHGGGAGEGECRAGEGEGENENSESENGVEVVLMPCLTIAL
jgi:hypothetical protein